MNSQDYRNLQEAYLDVYDSDLREEQEFESWIAGLLDEGYDLSDYNWDEMYEIYNEARDPGVKPYPGGARYSLRTQVRQSNEVKPAGEKPPGETSGYGQVSPDGKKDPLKTPAKDERNFANVLAPKPKAFPRIFGTLDPANTRTREITRQMGKPKPEAPRRGVIKASYETDIYDVILEYLINEGYADTYEAAESIMVNMSEEWRDDILNEATAMAKRGYDEVPIRNKIASQTRGGEFADKATKLADRETYGNKEMKAGREKLARKQRGTFRDTNSSSPGLRGYGHQSSDPAVKAKQDARGNQRARAALTPNERKQNNMESYDLFDYMMEYLMIEGYANTNENALVIMANMSEEWRESIVEARVDAGKTDDQKIDARNRRRDGDEYVDSAKFSPLPGVRGDSESDREIDHLSSRGKKKPVASSPTRQTKRFVEAKKPLPVAKMRDKENRMREEPYTPGETKDSTLDHNRRLGNIEDVRRSVSTRGGKRAMMNPMPDVRRPKNRDED